MYSHFLVLGISIVHLVTVVSLHLTFGWQSQVATEVEHAKGLDLTIGGPVVIQTSNAPMTIRGGALLRTVQRHIDNQVIYIWSIPSRGPVTAPQHTQHRSSHKHCLEWQHLPPLPSNTNERSVHVPAKDNLCFITWQMSYCTPVSSC